MTFDYQEIINLAKTKSFLVLNLVQLTTLFFKMSLTDQFDFVCQSPINFIRVSRPPQA